VTNDTRRRLAYVLIETYRDKFVLFDVEPGAMITLGFDYIGQPRPGMSSWSRQPALLTPSCFLIATKLSRGRSSQFM
jgi:hypothetical protein